MRQPAWKGGKSTVCASFWPFDSASSFLVHPRFRITLKHAVSRLLAGSSLFLFVSVTHATAPIGATPGSFAVSPSGAATYSIPIFVPPGTNGMQPQLSLNYSSQGGNGLLGMGWSIGGLSVIHHCGSTIAIDTLKGGVNYDTNDKFCLDGERLIWDATNGFYRTQHESWQKISVVGNYFTVTTKDGTAMTYGGTTDSQIQPKGNASVVRIWALNRIQNLNGNYLTISYNNQGYASGEYYPVSIAYTGTGSVAPYNFVYFDYSTSARSDVIQGYEGGSLISTTKLLTGIRSCTNSTCLANNGLVRQYNMGYVNDGAAGRARLKNIGECGSDGMCLPASGFVWQNGSTGFNDAIQWVQHGASEPGQMQYADVDGDGKADSLYFDTYRSNQVWVGVSTGAGFASPSPWVSYSPSSSAQIQYADVNGDGKADALYADIAGNRVLVSYSTGSGFTAPAEWAAFSAYGSSLDPGQVQFADVNGDGRADLIYQASNNAFWVSLVGASQMNSWLQVSGSFVSGQAQFVDVNGDGKADLVFQDNNNVFSVAISTGTAFSTPVPRVQHGGSFTAGQARYADINGDGKADLVFQGNDGRLWISLSTGAGFTTPQWWAQPTTSFGGSQKFTAIGSLSFTVPSGVYSLRVSMAGGGGGGGGGNNWGDWGSGGGGGGGYSQQSMTVTPGQVINGSVGAGGPAGGYSNSGGNGQSTIFGSLTATGGQGGQYQCCGGAGGSPGGQPGSTSYSGAGGDAGAGQGFGGDSGSPGGLYGGGGGAGFTSSYPPPREGAQGWVSVEWGAAHSQMQYVDANGDGMADALFFDVSDNSVWVYISTGMSFQPGTRWTQLGPGASLGNQMRYDDVTGDGLPDAMYFDTFRSNGVWVSRTKGVFPDLVTSVVNGLGVQTEVTYKPLTDGTVYSPGAVPSYKCIDYPCQDVQNASYVVSQFTQSNGVNGANATSYLYAGLKTHLTAATSQGFRTIQATSQAYDAANALITTVSKTTYKQTQQNLDGAEGNIASNETSVNGALVKSVTNSWNPVPLGGGRVWEQLANTIEQSYDLNGTSLPTVTTTYTYEPNLNAPVHAYGGNPTSIDVSYRVGGVSDGWRKTTDNNYSNDTANWILGRLTYSKVSAYAPGQAMQYRESSFDYDPTYTWRLSREIIEPFRTALTLTTAYGYDSFGNRSSKTVTGADLLPTSRTEYYDYTDGRGQFMMASRNALTHQTSYTYDLRTGAVMTVKDPNNITTTFTYNDGFGRKTQESRPGSPTTNIYYECWDGSIPGSGVKCPTPTGSSVTRIRTVTSGGGTNYAFHDMLGRVVQTNTQGFGGNYSYKVTQYDPLGRVTSVSHPYFSGEEVHCTTYGYDALGRVRTITEPGPSTTDCVNTTDGRVTSTVYNGLSTTVTSPFTTASPSGQVKTTVKNSQGLVATVTDSAGTTTNTYDPFGNLLRVAKSYDTGADIVMDYDERGRKKWMTDPDMGYWTYKYNTLGELTEQKDAKLQTISMTYDVLGRMKTRVLPNGEGTSTWNYDTATYGKGKLQSASNPSATETYVYDSSSRVSSQTTSVGGVTYTVSYTYDAYSRLLTLTYPITGFKIYHVYDSYGYLTEIRKDTATGLRYWKADTFDAHSRLTKETLGNNLISQRAYDHRTGDLLTIKTGTSTNPISVQNSSYQFDALDNLTYRSWYDGTTTRSETFGYDTLNRLTTVTGPANKTYSYYPNGNIQSKTGVGTYSYTGTGCTRPHAVCSITGTVSTSFIYDANGNMTSGNGRGYTWTTFNKPKTITQGSVTATYTYGPAGERVTQSTPTRSVTYIGKLYERETDTSAKDKSYIYAGANLVAMYRKAADGTSYVRYFHTDHLGSVEVVTDESRNISQRRSFDAFGKNRNLNGTDTTAASDLWFAKRGYTGHEHDDEIGLINMNAREYDPVVGRFISPDTLIPQATNSQAYNRYSYVINNPLSLTDPSGHSWLSKAVRSVTRSVKRAINQVTEQVARSTTYALQKISSVKYVGGLLSTGYLANPMFGPWYGLSTGDWKSVARATATAGVMATSWWAGGALYTNSGALTYVAGSYGIGYTSGYTISSIYGASGAEARDAAAKSGNAAAVMALLYMGWDAMRNSVNAGAKASGNTSECVAGQCTAGTRTSTSGYNPVTGEPNPVNSMTGFANQGMGTETLAGYGHPELRAPHSWDWIPGAKDGFEFVSKVHDFGNSFRYVDGVFVPFQSGLANDLFNVYSMMTMVPAAAYTAGAFGGLYFELNNDISLGR